MKLKMTNNEYEAYCKKLVSRVWNDENYSYSDYDKDCDNVEIIPFNLDNYGINQELQSKINIYFSSEEERENSLLLRGRCYGEGEWYKIIENLNLTGSMGYYYSGYYWNDECKIIFDYCEGDISLELFTCELDYKLKLEQTKKFYEEN